MDTGANQLHFVTKGQTELLIRLMRDTDCSTIRLKFVKKLLHLRGKTSGKRNCNSITQKLRTFILMKFSRSKTTCIVNYFAIKTDFHQNIKFK